jgi:hypothetical protein
MIHLKSLSIGPPGGWRYVCPTCNVPSKGITFGQLLSNVRQHYENMQHPNANLAAEVENWICQSLSPADQVEYCQTGVRKRDAVNWGEIVSFFTWLTGWLTSGRPLVPQAEAERRAAICAECPYNIGLSGCSTCRQSIGVLRNKLMKVQPTAVNDKLRACDVCGCDLKTIVHVPLETLHARQLDYSGIPWCWQNEVPEQKSPQ